jgi:hypothetical protein
MAHLYADTHRVEVEFVSGAGRDAASRQSLLASGADPPDRAAPHASGEGATIAVETLSVDDVRPVGAREILHARPLESA